MSKVSTMRNKVSTMKVDSLFLPIAFDCGLLLDDSPCVRPKVAWLADQLTAALGDRVPRLGSRRGSWGAKPAGDEESNGDSVPASLLVAQASRGGDLGGRSRRVLACIVPGACEGQNSDADRGELVDACCCCCRRVHGRDCDCCSDDVVSDGVVNGGDDKVIRLLCGVGSSGVGSSGVGTSGDGTSGDGTSGVGTSGDGVLALRFDDFLDGGGVSSSSM